MSIYPVPFPPDLLDVLCFIFYVYCVPIINAGVAAAIDFSSNRAFAQIIAESSTSFINYCVC